MSNDSTINDDDVDDAHDLPSELTPELIAHLKADKDRQERLIRDMERMAQLQKYLSDTTKHQLFQNMSHNSYIDMLNDEGDYVPKPFKPMDFPQIGNALLAAVFKIGLDNFSGQRPLGRIIVVSDKAFAPFIKGPKGEQIKNPLRTHAIYVANDIADRLTGNENIADLIAMGIAPNVDMYDVTTACTASPQDLNVLDEQTSIKELMAPEMLGDAENILNRMEYFIANAKQQNDAQITNLFSLIQGLAPEGANVTRYLAAHILENFLAAQSRMAQHDIVVQHGHKAASVLNKSKQAPQPAETLETRWKTPQNRAELLRSMRNLQPIKHGM